MNSAGGFECARVAFNAQDHPVRIGQHHDRLALGEEIPGHGHDLLGRAQQFTVLVLQRMQG